MASAIGLFVSLIAIVERAFMKTIMPQKEIPDDL
jgi:hypothetical protein